MEEKIDCKHEWIFFEKKIASKPCDDPINYQVYLGNEYLFFCKNCLEIKSKIIADNFDRELEYVFDPFPIKTKIQTKDGNTAKIAIGEINLLRAGIV